MRYGPVRYTGLAWNPKVNTKDIVDFLMKQRDQVATTEQIADAVGGFAPESTVREALDRLRKVNRVDEIFRDLWHLE